MYMLWRSFNERAEPINGDIIKRAITYAKKLILAYYDKKGEKHSQEIRVFIDNERALKTSELNYCLSFFNNKENIEANLTKEEFHFVHDKILSAVKIYGKHLEEDKQYIVLDNLEKEISHIKKLLRKHSVKDGNYDLYTRLYVELKIWNKIHD